jgi:hypothetical protein
MSQLTIHDVRRELDRLKMIIIPCIGGDFKVYHANWTKSEREKKAYYADSLEDALETGKKMAKGVIEPASLPCGVTVEDARALSTEPAATSELSDFPYGRYQIKCITTGKIGRITYPTKAEAQEWADIHASEMGIECEVIPYEPRDFAETPREALVEFARKIAALPLLEYASQPADESTWIESNHVAMEKLIHEARALSSKRKG